MATSVISKGIPKVYKIDTQKNQAIISGAASIINDYRKTLFCFANSQGGKRFVFSIFSKTTDSVDEYYLKTEWLLGNYSNSITTEISGNDLVVKSNDFGIAWGHGIAIETL